MTTIEDYLRNKINGYLQDYDRYALETILEFIQGFEYPWSERADHSTRPSSTSTN